MTNDERILELIRKSYSKGWGGDAIEEIGIALNKYVSKELLAEVLLSIKNSYYPGKNK